LVTSSDTDMIAEINSRGEILWSWWAPEHGYDVLPGAGGKTKFFKGKDQREYVSISQEHTTHVNSAIYYEDSNDVILATFFHQGQLVKIQKSTGEVEVILSGFKNPHSIRKRAENDGGGYMLCDSAAKRVLLLDNDLKQVREVSSPDFLWIQDSVQCGDSVYSLSNIDIKKHDQEGPENCIIEVNLTNGVEVTSKMSFGKQNHLYGILPIKKEQAEFWQEAWKSTPFDYAKIFPSTFLSCNTNMS